MTATVAPFVPPQVDWQTQLPGTRADRRYREHVRTLRGNSPKRKWIVRTSPVPLSHAARNVLAVLLGDLLRVLIAVGQNGRWTGSGTVISCTAGGRVGPTVSITRPSCPTLVRQLHGCCLSPECG